MTSVNTISEVKISKAVIDQPSSNASKSFTTTPPTPPTQNEAGSSIQNEAVQPTVLKETNFPQIQPSQPQHESRNAPPTQINEPVPDETPTQLSVLNLQPVVSPQKSSDTENTATYPVSYLPNTIESPYEIPIA